MGAWPPLQVRADDKGRWSHWPQPFLVHAAAHHSGVQSARHHKQL
jgi:hypothetical protein